MNSMANPGQLAQENQQVFITMYNELYTTDLILALHSLFLLWACYVLVPFSHNVLLYVSCLFSNPTSKETYRVSLT